MAEDNKKKKEETVPQPPAKSSNKILLIIIGVLVLIILGVSGLFIFSKTGSKPDKEQANIEESKHAKDSKSVQAEKGEAAALETLALEPFVVNLQDNTGTRYLKVNVNLELESIPIEAAKAKIVQIRDSIIILLSSKSYSDVGSIQGKYQLRDELAARINQVLGKGRVKAVYFTDFVIQ